MVKIAGKSLEETRKDVRESKLLKIAKEVSGEKFEIDSTLLGNINLIPKKTEEPHKTVIMVDLIYPGNRIRVNNRNYFDDAIALATAYEAAGELEFTVKKDYDE